MDRFHGALKRKILDKRDFVSQYMVGGACVDYAAYQKYSGYIEALDNVLFFCDEIEKQWSDGED